MYDELDVKGKIRMCAGKLRAWSGSRSKDFVKEIARRRKEQKALMSRPVTSEPLEEIKGLIVR